MGFQAALRLHLLGDSAIAALVGSRVYRTGADEANANNFESGYPYITFQRISSTRPHHLGGATPLANPRIQINSITLQSERCETLGELVRKRMNGYRGTMGSGDNTVVVRECRMDGEDDDWNEKGDASEQSVFTRQQDFLMWYVEATS